MDHYGPPLPSKSTQSVQSEHASRHLDLESEHLDHYSESEQPKRVCSKAKKHSDKRKHKARAKYYSQSSSSEEDESSVPITKSTKPQQQAPPEPEHQDSTDPVFFRDTCLHNMLRKWKRLGKFWISLIPGRPCLGPLPLC